MSLIGVKRRTMWIGLSHTLRRLFECFINLEVVDSTLPVLNNFLDRGLGSADKSICELGLKGTT